MKNNLIFLFIGIIAGFFIKTFTIIDSDNNISQILQNEGLQVSSDLNCSDKNVTPVIKSENQIAYESKHKEVNNGKQDIIKPDKIKFDEKVNRQLTENNISECKRNLQAKLDIIGRFSRRQTYYSKDEDTNGLRFQLANEFAEAINLKSILEFHSMEHYKKHLHYYKDEDSALKLMKQYFFPDQRDLEKILEVYAKNYSSQELADIITFYDTSGGKSLAEREQKMGVKIKEIFIAKANQNMQEFREQARQYLKDKYRD